MLWRIDPADYAADCLAAIDEWSKATNSTYGSLLYHLGPNFIAIDDSRTGVAAARYVLEEEEAMIYLACEDGMKVESVAATVGRGLSLEEVRVFLGELVQAKLMYEERGRYLALAVPADRYREAHALRPRLGSRGLPVIS